MGERVYLAGQSDAEKQLPTEKDINGKKAGNAFALVAPDLKTNSNGEVHALPNLKHLDTHRANACAMLLQRIQVIYKNVTLVSSAGPLTSELRDCKVK